MAKKYALVSTKGGVGKTTLSANLGGILADMGQKVLLIDADHQQSLSSLSHKADHGLHKLVTMANADGCISRTEIRNLDIILSDDPEKTINTWLRQSSSHFQYLHAALLGLDEQYDYISIDTKRMRMAPGSCRRWPSGPVIP